MRQKTSKFRKPIVAEVEVREKLAEFLVAKPMNQKTMAKEFSASQAQVSAWLNGAKPSSENLIKLGNKAPSPLNRWFWEKAGVDVAAIEREVRSYLLSRRSDPAVRETFDVRRPSSDSLLECARKCTPWAEVETPDSVPFPGLLISDPENTICIRAEDQVAGSVLMPSELAVVRLDRSGPRKYSNEDEIPYLLRWSECLVAVFFETLPNLRELEPTQAAQALQRSLDVPLLDMSSDQSSGCVAKPAREPGNEANAPASIAESVSPGVLFGTVRVQASEGWNGDLNKLFKGELPWRFMLDCGSTWLGLTKWTTQRLSLDSAQLERGVHILGAVIGRFSIPGDALRGIKS